MKKRLSETLNVMSVQNEESCDAYFVTFKILSYAASGDLGALKRMYFRGCDLNVKDYDDRTPMHLAAASGHLEIVKFLYTLQPFVDIGSLKDRFGKTPLDDAEREENAEICEYFRGLIAKKKASLTNSSTFDTNDNEKNGD